MKNILILILLCIFALPSFPQKGEGEKGKKAPGFKLEDLEGKLVDLKSFQGKGPILLSFWATWCKPCNEELMEYKKIYEELKSKGLTVIAISTDNEKSVAKVKPHVKSKGYPFTILLDTNSDVARKYYAQAVPYSVILDKNLNIVFTHLGYMKGDEMVVKEKIEQLLKN